MNLGRMCGCAAVVSFVGAPAPSPGRHAHATAYTFTLGSRMSEDIKLDLGSDPADSAKKVEASVAQFLKDHSRQASGIYDKLTLTIGGGEL